MNRRKVILLCVTLFVGINSILLVMDDKKVERKSYVREWSRIITADMYEKMHKPGVLTPVEENNVYFNEKMGTFGEFLLEEGAKVNVGDALYTYQVPDYYATKAQLESEVDTINGEIAAIEQAMSSISNYQIPKIEMVFGDGNEKENREGRKTTIPSADAEYMKEQYVTEKENELAQKNAQLKSVQAQLTELEMSGDTITVESPFQGNVTNVSDSLDDPIITIESTQLHVTGELTEKERMVLEQGMPAEISLSENDTVLQGTVQEVSDSPKTVALQGTSLYPFYVAFTDEAKDENDTEQLLPGYHIDMAITTNESANATVAREDAVFGKTLWKMTSEGNLVKQKITTGIHMNEQIEITKGAKPGEWVAKDQKRQFRSNVTFITPLKINHIHWKQFFKQGNWKKDVVTGLLTR
ncbi:efflux RND transporter periplasmic adaptor subunit [Virgibacillus dakarensis]|uniref:efflux RND transporter periplasmic adaptor subunit n=1 Tax=Virgibacillus dakarensis TaxID=1917889 RepID=UPI000B43345A|nr:efflux RND transporter periplasmic adaptor subunit [Virgibacillus dakarensis]MBT2218376.1 efflux RND transporter periplasmic adaptor subunit [Virgibacillus dakarensis]